MDLPGNIRLEIFKKEHLEKIDMRDLEQTYFINTVKVEEFSNRLEALNIENIIGNSYTMFYKDILLTLCYFYQIWDGVFDMKTK